MTRCFPWMLPKVAYDGGDLGGIESEFGHGRMACQDAFRKGLAKIAHVVTLMQISKRRRLRIAALVHPPESVAHTAIALNENPSPFHDSRGVGSRLGSGMGGHRHKRCSSNG